MPEILQITPERNVIAPYETYAVNIQLRADYDNPFDYDEVAVDVRLTGPDGAQHDVMGFYRPDRRLDPATGELQDGGQPDFCFRFTPTLAGHWHYTARVTDREGTSPPITGEFRCAGSGEQPRFVRTVAGNYLQDDSGALFLPIGENMAWPAGDPYTCYRDWLAELVESGGNCIRLWHAHWGLGIEWKNDGAKFGGLRQYAADNLAYLDWLFDHCQQLGVLILLTLQHHGPVSSKVDSNWNDSPYNFANAGPCRHPWEFFTDASARAHTRNRLQYCVARWGHSPALLAWELFNEVDWTDNYAEHRSAISTWHRDMAAFLKSIDPYAHLVTTSYAKAKHEPAVWRDSAIDFTQTHHYQHVDNLERALVQRTRRYLDEYAKPTLNAEFGLGGSLDLARLDPGGIHLHNALWAGLFSGGLGVALTWWWDTYVHPGGLFRHFAALRAVSDRIPFAEAQLTPTQLFVSGAPHATELTPSLGWAELGTKRIEVDSFGSISPANAHLSRYLYGARWNRSLRSPPTFRVHCARAGQFTVRTGDTTGRRPRLAISVDGVRRLRKRAFPNQEYTIDLSAGVHEIRVDNTGKDWISVAGYRFAGIGSALDGYALLATDRRTAAGWVLNHQHHHRHVAAGQLPPPVSGAELHLPGLTAGDYFVSWFDCQDGRQLHQQATTAGENGLSISLPEVRWDLAFLVEVAMDVEV